MVKRSASRSSEEASPSGLDSDDLNIDFGNLNIKSAKPKHPKVKLPKVLNPIPKRHKVKNPDIDVYLVKSTHNMDSQLTAKALHSRINTNVSQLLQRFENIMATATIQNPSHTATAVETYQLDVESTALIRSAEDILSLSRTMKEMWLFGKLDTIGEDERDVERREKLDKDVLAVEEALKEGALAKIAPEKQLFSLPHRHHVQPSQQSNFGTHQSSQGHSRKTQKAHHNATTENHPLNPPSLPLTLIVATTPIRVASPATPDHEITRLGIGLKGTLPWPRIKTDMSFFARVTSRPPAPGTTNAIIMGRKTYDSVPKSLRPLAKRISVVITRDTSGSVREGVLQELEARKAKLAAKAAESAAAGTAPTSADEPITDAIVTPSLDAALSELDSVYGSSGRLGKIFVIGGAEIYGASLRMNFGALPRPVRVVMTNVVRKPEGGEEIPYECDTFWPLDTMDQSNGWRSASPEELTEWVGEEVTGEWKREGEVEVQMVGFEKLD